MRSRTRPAVASVTMPSSPRPDLDPHAPAAWTSLLPRHDQQDDPGVPRRVADRGVLTDAPGPPDLARDVGLFTVADGGECDHGDLGAGGRFEPGDEVGDPRLGRLIHDAGDIGHESGGAGRKEASGRGVLREDRSGGQLKHRQERDSFGWCPAQ